MFIFYYFHEVLLLGHTQLLSHISLFSVVQYISLLFIGMLIVISVRGFLSNLMKVIIYLGAFWLNFVLIMLV